MNPSKIILSQEKIEMIEYEKELMNLSYSELKERYDKVFNKVVSSEKPNIQDKKQLQLLQNEIDIREIEPIILY